MATDVNAAATVLDAIPFRKRVLDGTKWQIAGQIFAQGLRFVTNLILAKLLFPEAFGIAALINTFVTSLNMFSDIGVRDTVIHNEQGDEAFFLNTVWTIQIIRGFLLWIVTCAAAVPFAWFYGESQLAWLLPIAGIAAVIRGFSSTSIQTASRHILVRWNVITFVAGNASGAVAMILLAAIWPHVLVLVLGALVNAVVYVVVSYQFGNHKRHQLHWNKEAAGAVARFGRWIIPSSSLTIMLSHGDKMILGKLMTTTTLGLYSIGAGLASLALMVYDQLAVALLHPIYARTRDLPREEARRKVRKFRLVLCGLLVPAVYLLIFLSHWLFGVLYDPRYAQAALFCQIMAFGYTLRITTDIGPVFQAYAKPERHFLIMVVRTLATVIAILIGYAITHDYMGIVYGLALSPLLYYPFQVFQYRRVGMWQPEIDAIGLIPAAAMIIGYFCNAF